MSLGPPKGVVRFGSSRGHHLIRAFALVFDRGFHVHLVRDGTTGKRAEGPVAGLHWQTVHRG
jgi:hypothetical protein